MPVRCDLKSEKRCWGMNKDNSINDLKSLVCLLRNCEIKKLSSICDWFGPWTRLAGRGPAAGFTRSSSAKSSLYYSVGAAHGPAHGQWRRGCQPECLQHSSLTRTDCDEAGAADRDSSGCQRPWCQVQGCWITRSTPERVMLVLDSEWLSAEICVPVAATGWGSWAAPADHCVALISIPLCIGSV